MPRDPMLLPSVPGGALRQEPGTLGVGFGRLAAGDAGTGPRACGGTPEEAAHAAWVRTPFSLLRAETSPGHVG